MKLQTQARFAVSRYYLSALFLAVAVPFCIVSGRSVPNPSKAQHSSRQAIRKPATSWKYDPGTQPITLDELRRIIRSPKTTPAIHGLVISRATISHLLEYAVEEYDKRRKAQPNNPVLQCAFGQAVIGIGYPPYEPSNQKLRIKQQDPAFRAEAASAIEKAVKGAGAKSSFCWATAGYMRVVAFPLPPHEREFKQGIDALEKAIQLDPKRSGNYNTLAFAYLTMNDSFNPQRALELARRAAEINPKSSNAYYFQALSLMQLKKSKEANEMLVKWAALLPPALQKSLQAKAKA